MTLKERLDADMKEAMRAKEEGRTRLSVIRMVRSAIKYVEIEQKQALNDEGVLAVLAREVKQRQDVLPEYEHSGRTDLVVKLHDELEVLRGYLPEPLSEGELRSEIERVIEAVGAQGAKDMGRVMAQLMPKVRGRADGQTVNRLVKELLAPRDHA